jgi:hypothetical protein
MNIANVPEDIAALYLRTQRQIVEVQAARRQLAVTRQETRALIEQAHLVHPDAAWPHLREWPASTAAVEEGPPLTPHLTQSSVGLETRQAARRIGAILRELPLEQQVNIVKALAARTMVLAREHLDAQTKTTMAA